jgi:transcriptional regulator with XRE-family HTH domain
LAARSERELRLSRRLKHLYATIPRLNDDWVAAELKKIGISVTPQYIQQLRTGTRTNPSLNLVFGIAEVCGVRATYLVADDEEARRVNDQIAFVRALKKAGVTALALRAADLDPESLSFITELVERERRRSGLPPDDHP